MRPCTCDRTDRCRPCWLWHHDQRYRTLWGATSALGPPAPARVVRRPLPCLYLGPLVSRARCSCPRQDVRRCDRGHGNVRAAEQCETCADYEPDG